MTMTWPLVTFLDLENWKIENQLNIGMLHINWKLKTAVLQWKHVQTSERSNDWPQADLNWPLMTLNFAFWNICMMNLKNADHRRTLYETNLLLFIWPLMTLNWPLNESLRQQYYEENMCTTWPIQCARPRSNLCVIKVATYLYMNLPCHKLSFDMQHAYLLSNYNAYSSQGLEVVRSLVCHIWCPEVLRFLLIYIMNMT